MKAVAELKVELTVEERNLLSVAYKNVVGALLCFLRCLLVRVLMRFFHLRCSSSLLENHLVN